MPKKPRYNNKSQLSGQGWWCMSAFQALGRWRPEDEEIQASLDALSGLLSVAVINAMGQKQLRGGEGLFGLQVHQ